MEAELLTKILAGGGGATTAIWFIYYIFKLTKRAIEEKVTNVKNEVLSIKNEGKEALERIEKMHVQGMGRIDKAIETISNLTTTLAVHAKELEYGEKRFVKIEDDILMLRKSDHDIRNKIHDIRNTMVTQDHLKEIRQYGDSITK